MNYEFKLPDIGEGLTEGEVVKWHVKEGDVVSENQPLASVLTDKAEVEIPSPKAGTIAKLHAKPGEKVRVHSALVTFGDVGTGKKKAPMETAKTESVPAGPGKKKTANGSPAEAGDTKAGEYVFKLPDIGEGLTEGEIVKWHVKEGQTVQENQPLANVLTDKAEVEVPSPKAGKIVKLHAKAGDKVKVHAALVSFALAAGASAEKTEAPAAGTAASAPARQTPPVQTRASKDVLATPMIRQMAKKMGVELSSVPGTGPGGRVLEADLRGVRGGSTAPAGAARRAVNASPAVQHLAAELGVDASTLTGTGPGGRVAEWDVRKAAGPARSAPARAIERRQPSGPLVFTPPSTPSEGEERAPFVGIRRKIAEKMRQSVSLVAQVTHMDECDMTALVALREDLKEEAARRGVKLTYMPFIIRAVVKALKEFPNFNASLDEPKNEVVVKRFYNVGIAVNAGQGLVVPNIKGADGKDIWGLASEVQRLAERVRAGKIDVASLQQGTFTLTNIGPLGGLFATPIVNHPEVAILGLMKLQKRPVFHDGGVFVREMMNLALSFDHRVVDGADAASFMNTVIKSLENPRTIL